jgi:hypothetical protein
MMNRPETAVEDRTETRRTFSTFWEACTTGKQKETKQVGINGINMIPGRGNGLAMVSERIQPVRHLDEVCGVQAKLDYTPYGPDNPTPTSKKSKAQPTTSRAAV